MNTADGVEIDHLLRVWVRGFHPASVDLNRSVDLVDQVVVRTDSGRVMTIMPSRATARHGLTGSEPPPLGMCKWVLSCGRPAVRMHPHPLMSPVAVCARCIADFDLQ